MVKDFEKQILEVWLFLFFHEHHNKQHMNIFHNASLCDNQASLSNMPIIHSV